MDRQSNEKVFGQNVTNVRILREIMTFVTWSLRGVMVQSLPSKQSLKQTKTKKGKENQNKQLENVDTCMHASPFMSSRRRQRLASPTCELRAPQWDNRY